MNTGLTASFTKSFPAGPVIRVDNLTTSTQAGVTVLFGPSGSGKTTVLRCIAGLGKPEEGAIRFNGKVWSDAGRHIFLPARKRNIGLVTQDYALFPHMTVGRNIGYGLDHISAGDRRRRVAEMLEWIGLEGLGKRMPHELSGGQQQRVALARAVARRPHLLLLDEPLSALDTPTRQRLRGELRGLLRQSGVPALFVTHDRQEALALGDDLVVMHDGNMVQQGTVQDVFNRPNSLAAASILAVETIQTGHVMETTDGLATVEVKGTRLIVSADNLPAGEVIVCIRAEDVTLAVDRDGRGSPRNRLPAIVRNLTPDGSLVRVELDCGFPLLALLTKQGCQDIDLREGAMVCAVIKASNIHLIQRRDS